MYNKEDFTMVKNITMPFDTLRYSKNLINAGFTPQQAEAQAEALKDVIDENLATKRDLFEVKRDLETAIHNVELKLKELELRMTIKLGGMLVGGIGGLVVLMKLFHL